MNAIAWLLGQFAPDAGLRYLRSRELFKRAYEGASTRDGWKPRRSGASPNTDHRADAATLRIRARALVQNVPYITRGLGSLVANTIGTGITPRSLAANSEKIDALWEEWGEVADADGRTNIYGLQAAAYRAMEQDGEVLIRLRARRVEDGLPVPLQLQLLEIDWLDTSRSEASGRNTIINGIEYDPLGRVVNYWIFEQHPGETVSLLGRSRTRSYPVSADRIIHLFNPERPGQGRGFTRLAPVIARVRDLQLYEDAELQRKNLETRLSVLARGDAAQLNMSPVDSTSEVRRTGELGALGSGSIVQLPTDVTDLTVVEPKAADGYVDYVKYNLHLIAAGMGVTYEMLTGDVKDVNFSSARVALLEFRRNAEQLQWITLVPRMCNPIWRAFVDAAALAGKMQRDYRVDWATPKWEYVDPEKDVAADLAEVRGGLSSLSEKLRRRGYKPDLVFAEIKKDFDRLKADGTLDIMLMMLAKAAPAEGAAPAPAQAQRAARSGDDLEGVRELLRGIEASVRAMGDRPQVSPVSIDLSRGVEAAAERAGDALMQRFADMPINLTIPAQPAPVVNVEVRSAEQAPPVINIQPNLHVDVTAQMPSRTVETTLVKDAHGKPWKSIAVERDTTPPHGE
jgi:lambda family phage portal protein